MSGKKTYLSLLAGESVDRFVRISDYAFVNIPGERPDLKEVFTEGVDWFGCSWTAVPNDGPMPGMTPTPGKILLKDLADFKVAIPTEKQVRAFDWEGYARTVFERVDRAEKALVCRSLNGPFERMHCLVGFEEALCAFYEDPETVRDFFEAILEYKKVVVDCVAEYLKPEVMIFDDDYGTAKSMFISAEMWRDFFPAFWKPLIDHVHSKGIKFELHSCGYITPLVPDFVELGVDILQPLQPNNNLEQIKERWGDKIILEFFICDKRFDTCGLSEDELRAELRGYYETLAPGGNFIPTIPPIKDRYYEIMTEVLNEVENEFFGSASQ